MTVVHVNTNEEYKKEVLDSDKPVIIDFWAQWCGPCKMFGPIFEQMAEERDDVKFVKVDVDEATDVAADFSIMSIPTIALVKSGEEVERQMGALTKDMLKDFLDSNL